MFEWTLEKELCKLAKFENFHEALQSLDILNSANTDFEIQKDQNWERGGTETYLFKFSIKLKDGKESSYLLKACVAYAPNSNLEKILCDWIARRQLISNHGIKTPKLFAYGNGVILEEYIPYRLKDILQSSQNPPPKILKELAFLAGVLSKLKFDPIDIFSDLRSHGDDVIVIDFGQDLGPSGVMPNLRLEIYKMLLQTLTDWGVKLEKNSRDELLSVFISSSVDEIETMN